MFIYEHLQNYPLFRRLTTNASELYGKEQLKASLSRKRLCLKRERLFRPFCQNKHWQLYLRPIVRTFPFSIKT